VACGLDGVGVTSLSDELRRPVSAQDVIVPLCNSFQRVFNLDLVYDDSVRAVMK
jgi:lipoate-protein ligase B